jgi:hypothetical protein
MDRLLLFVGLGAMGVLARFLGLVFDGQAGQDNAPKLMWPARPVAYFFVFIHLVAAPLSLPFRAGLPFGPERILDQMRIPPITDPALEHQDLIVVNPPSPIHAGYVAILAELNGTPIPSRVRVLAPGLSEVTVRRTDDRTLIVSPAEGYLARPFDRLFRSIPYPMALGEKVELTGMTVEVTALTEDGNPAEAKFSFAIPLEDPSLRWIYSVDGRFEPFTPPPVGQAVKLKPKPLRLRG